MIRKIVGIGFAVAFAVLLVASSVMCAINATATVNSDTTRTKVM